MSRRPGRPPQAGGLPHGLSYEFLQKRGLGVGVAAVLPEPFAEFETDKGLDGCTLEFMLPHGAEDWVLSETIFVVEDTVFLVETAGISALPWGDHFRLSPTFPEKDEGDGWFYHELEKRTGRFRFA